MTQQIHSQMRSGLDAGPTNSYQAAVRRLAETLASSPNSAEATASRYAQELDVDKIKLLDDAHLHLAGGTAGR